ncbi:MAG: hypothetical protein Q8K65_03580 [Alphaproteobacteria bacterium]|nr:hypothetical protein [Alphaproteobacteria bacterium]
MKLKIQYKGRTITPQDLEKIGRCFGEKIDDMKLCQAVILRVMQSHNALARGAVVRALDTGKCGPGEGGRAVRKIIRKARRDLGYRYEWHERIDRLRAAWSRDNFKMGIAIIWHDMRRIFGAVFGEERRF